ncbi:MAG: hypothetical protein U0797_10145 [Gemmataceae bacterium]
MRLLRILRGLFEAPQPPAPPRPLLFLHIPKTAGSSVNEFLVNRFAADELHSIYPSFGADVRGMVPGRPVACYAGHVYYDLTTFLPPNLTVFTALRDPVERALSAYFFYKRVPREELLRGGPYVANLQHMDLAEFALRFPLSARATFGNYQTYYFSRDYASEPQRKDDPIDRADLGRAKDNLAKCVVGLTDRLHDALTLLCHEFGWRAPDRVAEANRTADRPRSLDGESMAWLEEHTAMDAELVRFGRELFEQRWDEFTRRHPAPVEPGRPREYRLKFDQPIPGYGWHPREAHALGHYCFVEPDAWLECPAPKGRRVRVQVRTLNMLPLGYEGPVTLRVNGEPVALTRREIAAGACYEGVAAAGKAATLRLDFHAERPVRPCDVLPGNQDRRLLSLAVREVRLTAA